MKTLFKRVFMADPRSKVDCRESSFTSAKRNGTFARPRARAARWWAHLRVAIVDATSAGARVNPKVPSQPAGNARSECHGQEPVECEPGKHRDRLRDWRPDNHIRAICRRISDGWTKDERPSRWQSAQWPRVFEARARRGRMSTRNKLREKNDYHQSAWRRPQHDRARKYA
jgi:hypothetical protein